MSLKPEFVVRELESAAALGLRKPDVFYQTARCTACGAEMTLRSRLSRIAFGAVADIERQCLDVLLRDGGIQCGSCRSRALDRLSGQHVFLTYSERLRSHLVLTLLTRREDGGRVKVTRRVWLLRADGVLEEMEVEDDRMATFWAESSIRMHTADPDPLRCLRELESMLADHGDDPLLLRELGTCSVGAEQPGRAARYYERSLDVDPEQTGVMVQLGRLLHRLEMYEQASFVLGRACVRAPAAGLFAEFIVDAYRAGRHGAVAAAAAELVALEADSLVALRARASMGSAADLGAWGDAWRDLGRAARRTGDRHVALTAARWEEALALPLPDWRPLERADAYRARVEGELDAADGAELTVATAIAWGGASLPVDLVFADATGTRWFVVLFDARCTAWLEHQVAVYARAVMATSPGARFLPLSPYPLSYAALAWSALTPDAVMALESDADTTFTLPAESAAALVAAAASHFGRELDGTVESLAEVDAILERLHEDGFGSMLFGLQCQVASYVGEVLANEAGGGWVDGTDDDDEPRVFRLEGGDTVPLVARARRALLHPDDRLSALVGSLLGHEA